jgi:hypothetical protein
MSLDQTLKHKSGIHRRNASVNFGAVTQSSTQLTGYCSASTDYKELLTKKKVKQKRGGVQCHFHSLTKTRHWFLASKVRRDHQVREPM